MKFQFRIWHILLATIFAGVAVVAVQHWRHQAKLKMGIGEVAFSLRAHYRLQYAEIQTIRELVQWNEDELLDIRNMGETTVVEIREKLDAMGFSLKYKE